MITTPKTPVLTVCIVHYRKLAQLKKTVECLENHTNVPYQLKIFNNGYEGDGIREYLDVLADQKNTSVIFHHENIGCSPARHILAQNVDTPFTLMLDDDMYVNEGWDRAVWQKFDDEPMAGAIGFSIYRSNGSFWLTGGRNLTVKGKILHIERLAINPDRHPDIHFMPVDDVSAGAMIYRRELSSLIPWDPEYFIGFEDLEKGLHFKQSPYTCYISVQSKFIHDKVSEDRRQKKYNQARRDYHKCRLSYIHFLEKNGLRMIWSRHIFYKYICQLPNQLVREIAYLWFKLKRFIPVLVKKEN